MEESQKEIIKNLKFLPFQLDGNVLDFFQALLFLCARNILCMIRAAVSNNSFIKNNWWKKFT